MTNSILQSESIHLLQKGLKEKGPKRMFLIGLSFIVDFFFDLEFGTDTYSWVNVDRLGIDHEQEEHASMYQPTHTVPLRNLLEMLQIPAGKVLLDLGSGKGKVLLIASEFGFKEVRGVEISTSLCKVTEKNCAIYRKKTGVATKFVIIESDVLKYQIQDDEDVFYLYNPFDACIMKPVLHGISESCQRRSRKIWVIYRNAVCKDIVEEILHPSASFTFITWGQEFVIYEVDQGVASDQTSAAV